MGKNTKKYPITKLKSVLFDEEKLNSIKHLVPPSTIKRLNVIPHQWWVTSEQYKNEHFEQLFEAILTMTAESLTFWSCKTPQLVNSLMHINFIQLQTLQLVNCRIISLEQLTFLKIPHLSDLNLMTNKISNIKPLVKFFSGFKSLRILNLDNNSFSSSCDNYGTFISRLKAGTKHKKLCIQVSFDHDKKTQRKQIQLQDISIFTKFEPQSLRWLRLVHSKRILQHKVMNCLQRKFKPQSYLNLDGQVEEFQKVTITYRHLFDFD